MKAAMYIMKGDFNPRSSCEERQRHSRRPARPHSISIHAPHARSDVGRRRSARRIRISIHAPHARSDVAVREVAVGVDISIHAPHARSD